MKVSMKSRYALKAIVELAINNNYISIKEISRKQNVPERYLEQIFSQLKKTNIIKSIKGPKGGYILNCDINKITVLDIVNIIEGDFLANTNEEDILGNIIKKEVLDVLGNNIINTLNNIVIKELVKKYEEEIQGTHYMYYI